MRKTKDTARDGATGHGQVGREEESGGRTVGETNGFSIQEWSRRNTRDHFVAWMIRLRPWRKIHISDGWRKAVRVGQRDKAWGKGAQTMARLRHGENAWV